jgi:hypothetical protein
MGLLLETNQGNKYILVAIDHYLKWCEANVVAKFFENYNICKMGYQNSSSHIMVVSGV